MFWGLANCPPETVERVLGKYNKNSYKRSYKRLQKSR